MSRFLNTHGPVLLLCVMGIIAVLAGACRASTPIASAASPTPSPSLTASDPATSRTGGTSPVAAPTVAPAPAAETSRAGTAAVTPAAARPEAQPTDTRIGAVSGPVCNPCTVMSITAGGQTVAGEVTARGREGTIEVLGFHYGVKAPRDVATGQPTGRRQYQPLIIRKRIDKASPLLMRAMVSNTPLTVKVDLYRDGADGNPERYYTIKMEDVVISNLAVFGFEPQPLGAEAARTFVIPHVLEKSGSISASDVNQEEISFTFGKITVTHEPTKTTAEDTESSIR